MQGRCKIWRSHSPPTFLDQLTPTPLSSPTPHHLSMRTPSRTPPSWDRSPTHLMSIALQRGSSALRPMPLAPPAHACSQPTPQGCPDWASARNPLVWASALLRVGQAFRHGVRRTSSASPILSRMRRRRPSINRIITRQGRTVPALKLVCKELEGDVVSCTFSR
ncbi:hypothetical protein CABS01_17049 [Colletotrichum abscissum]|uniref:uncharacterized protein n=1 Tax=Colletotrichum abscissum TaxID=1671311 RepID=UPI0027D6BD5E|nr:uncharacterized protein CABS01_17049 [Colletotrichum abscissum]KAK1496744.1 hypothetical protein CABS01_17049 [Colletotrichum abscissum]